MASLPVREARGGRRRRHLPGWIAPAILLAGAIGIVAFFYLQAPTFDQEEAREKVINVVLPPPPPPPPPEQKPLEPEKTVIEEPTPQPPTPAPQPPQPAEAPAAATDALSAREGAGPSNYGLVPGSGGGTVIGGTPGRAAGGLSHAAYGNAVRAELLRAIQRDAALNRGRWSARVAITVSASGRITGIRLLDSTGVGSRDAALRGLSGLQLSRQPPEGIPEITFRLQARDGA